MKPSASSPDVVVDNEATAELPVLDVAAYETTLDDPAHSDTWVLPGGVKLDSETIPTLRVADLECTADISLADFSGTHEMPAIPQFKNALKSALPAPLATANAVTPAKAAPAAAPAIAATTPAPAKPAATRVAASSAAIVVPPSPPLIEELRGALAAAERRIEELNERARIADAERGVAVARANSEAAQLRQQLDGHLESIRTSRERDAARHAEQAALQDELFRRADRIDSLEVDLSLQEKVVNEKVAALAEALTRAEASETDAMNLRAGVARRDRQIAVLEADLVARQHRETVLKARLEEATESVNANVPDLRAQLLASEEQVRTLERALKEAQARIDEKNHDLQIAEESIRNLEVDVRDKTGKLEEANVTVEEWRAVIAESQRSILERDSRIREMQSDLDKRMSATLDSSGMTSEEVALEGAARVLIRTDGNTDFVHVLSRRTRIGRGSDNEIVIDTKHISRYHAVLLAGPVHTTVEDLQSTNGVFVNGKRVTRQALKDGDRLQIGKTQFRYSVRD